MKITMTIEFDNLEEAQKFLGQSGKSTEILQIRPEPVKFGPSKVEPVKVEILKAEPVKPLGATDWPFPPDDMPLENISPGDPAIGKIGATAKDHILSELRAGRQPHTKYAEHLKLLWARGEVRFDGTLYRSAP